ncbi:hypothetical protein BpHYR1_037150 [Brachionus plicatilis]|uniref:Uncharacterized protein n=1 Tax=Brachionus plicatilis TaxID=10195 RepID=A0A3M7TBG7_BRAPC|nr:hypothetical protein BpHYR1_037150 [Brachionus plicatilis]
MIRHVMSLLKAKTLSLIGKTLEFWYKNQKQNSEKHVPNWTLIKKTTNTNSIKYIIRVINPKIKLVFSSQLQHHRKRSEIDSSYLIFIRISKELCN